MAVIFLACLLPCNAEWLAGEPSANQVVVGNGLRVDGRDVLVHEDVTVAARVHVRVDRLLQLPLGDVDLGGVLDLG